MGGKPEAEPRAGEQLHCQREPEEDDCKRWPGGQVGHTLHLVSAVAQWILLLACLIYLGFTSKYLQSALRSRNNCKKSIKRVICIRDNEVDIFSQSDKVLWTHIRYSGRSSKGVAVNLTAELGPIQIRNGSILIPCDGLYLVSLKSSIYLEEERWLKLTLRGTSSSAPWEQTVQSNDSTVNLTTVLYLFQEDSITLWTNSSAIISDLSFSLVLISDNMC